MDQPPQRIIAHFHPRSKQETRENGETIIRARSEEFLVLAQIDAQHFALALEQHRLPSVLEDDVAEWIALLDFPGDLGVEMVVGVLGLPVAAVQVQVVAEGAVGHDALAAGAVALFGHEQPVVRLGRFGEQRLEGGAQGGFVLDAVFAVGLQRLVVGLDRLVGGLDEGRVRHRWQRLRGDWARAGPL